MPDGLPDDTTCAVGMAFVFSPHLHYLETDFFASGAGTPRTKCGDLPFDESVGSPGSVVFRQAIVDTLVDQWQTWGRRLRNANSGDAPEVFVDTSIASALDTFSLQAPANDQHDLIYFDWRHHADSAAVLNSETEINAAAQLWRHIPRPINLDADSLDSSHAQLSWLNLHAGRGMDSTEIYRNSGGGWLRIATVGPGTDAFVDSIPSWGTHRWIARHVTGVLHFPTEDVGALARPTSQFTGEQQLSWGPPPPGGLLCEGNFDATMDCRWFNSVADAPSVISRDGVARDTLPGGGVNTLVTWTDSAVTRGNAYTYRVQHYEGGMTGEYSAPHEAVADPVPPENLVCAGTGETTISCVWVDKEPDSVAVERKSGKSGDWGAIQHIGPGVMILHDPDLNVVQHCYRARHFRLSEFTGWSNVACAVPGDGGPLGPSTTP
ncbi:MAG TPA: hypothetical protein VD707_05705 [Gemmatimonadales bacterium]|nr:hypothetical protein [Gemmatimonadales bacterium]